MVYPAARPNGLSVIACPGGAYQFLSMGQEGHMMAQWFNALGITYAVLKYRMPNQGHHEVPLSDVEQAIRLLHTQAAHWKIKQVGVLGSSAGGHLASTAATHLKGEYVPDFQILLYPVITMDADYTHAGTRQELLGNTPDENLIKRYSNEKQVSAQTPPAFILHCADDTTVPARNSIEYFLALQQHHVPTALHIYPRDGRDQCRQ
jgi:acetyl esterase/lipase